MGSIGACGGLDYLDVETQIHINNFLVNLNRVCSHISAEFNASERIRVLIYGASTPGRLASLYISQTECFEVLGIMDNNRAEHRAWIDIGAFNPPGPPVLGPSDWTGGDVDAVVCTTHPRHYRGVHGILRQAGLASKIYYIYRSDEAEPMGDSLPPVLIGTVGRCGTHWLRGLLKLALAPLGYCEIHGAFYENGIRRIDEQTFSRLGPGEFSIDHFSMTGALENVVRSGGLKAVYLYRDPRDVLVSQCHYRGEDVRFSLDCIGQLIDRIEPWVDIENMLLVKYEDLSSDATGQIHRLCDHLGIQVDGKIIADAVESLSFKNLSGGREIGDEDTSSHYRKGVSGDWVNYLSPGQQLEITTRFGEKLAGIGYR